MSKLMICPKAKDGSCDPFKVLSYKYRYHCTAHEHRQGCDGRVPFTCPACIHVEPDLQPENCSGCLGKTLHHTCGKEPDATKQPTPTMPLRELQKQLRDVVQACRDFDDNDEETTKRLVQVIQNWLPAHDSEVARQAVREFAEKIELRIQEEMHHPILDDWGEGYQKALQDSLAHIRAMADGV